MTVRWITMGAVALALGVGAAGGYVARVAFLQPPPSLDEAARTYISYYARDPDGAQFRGVRGNDHLICGEVNLRNGFGGYEGFRGFVVLRSAPPGPAGEPIVFFDTSESNYRRMSNTEYEAWREENRLFGQASLRCAELH